MFDILRAQFINIFNSELFWAEWSWDAAFRYLLVCVSFLYITTIRTITRASCHNIQTEQLSVVFSIDSEAYFGIYQIQMVQEVIKPSFSYLVTTELLWISSHSTSVIQSNLQFVKHHYLVRVDFGLPISQCRYWIWYNRPTVIVTLNTIHRSNCFTDWLMGKCF